MQDFREQIIGSYYKSTKDTRLTTAHTGADLIVTDVFVNMSLTAICNERYDSSLKTPSLTVQVYYPTSKSLETMDLTHFLNGVVLNDKYKLSDDKTGFYKIKHFDSEKGAPWWASSGDGL